MSRVIYSNHYNIGFLGLERLHPFDSRKYGRAWRELRKHFDKQLKELAIHPKRPINEAELLEVHQMDYLNRLKDSRYIAQALEIPPVAMLPHFMIDRCVLHPMRWATMGSVMAARAAMEHGLAINLGGGFHHAKPDGGEGFCIYNDIALAIHTLRQEERLAEESKVLYIDLDAHQGNGVCHAFREDKRVHIFDMYHSQIYPKGDVIASNRIDIDIRLNSHWTEKEYLDKLKSELPRYLETSGDDIHFAVYNAGTDIYASDPLGQLNISATGILIRDLFVILELRKLGIPTIMLLSGGYTKESYQLVATSVIKLLAACPSLKQ